MAPPSNAVTVTPLVPGPAGAAPPNHLDPAALQPNIGAMMRDVARLIRRRFERRARQTGLPITREQARALLHIARNEGMSQAAVATTLDIEPIALVRIIDRLHEEGLVERRLHPTDRRVRTLWLTPRAWGVVDRVLNLNAETREAACAGLPPATRELLLRALVRMKANLAEAEATESAAAE
jgi:MarR family transcriptional regulator, transcriptional regulator for hemolysin